MQKWAFLTVFAYVILVVVLFIPLIFLVHAWILNGNSDIDLDSSVLGAWQLWLYFAIVLAIQALLLLYPVRVSQDTLVPRKLTWIPILTTALMLSILVLGVVWSVTMAIWGDDILSDYFPWGSLAFLLGVWLVWSWVFYRFSRTTVPKDFSQRTIAWLIKGSILELLVAVPSHIIVRRRDECCAPGFTALGISAGLVIMILAFGPGLYFLFQKRIERMKPRSERTSQ